MTTDLFDLADKPQNTDDLPQGEADDRKEKTDPATNEDHDQGSAQAPSESSTDDHDLDQLPEGMHLDADGWTAYDDDQHPTKFNGARLSPDHWRELVIESSIDPALVLARGYATMDASTATFIKRQGITPRALEAEHFPGLLVIMHAPDGDGLTFQWKPATPVIGRNGKPQKYISRVADPRLDIHPAQLPLLADLDRRLWIGEGVKKGDALATRDELAINLTGVWNWRTKDGPLPDWEHVPVKGRQVVICYDADAWTKPNVLQAMVRLGTWLQSRGARVSYLIVPDQANGRAVKGVDDFLAAGGTVDQLLQAATRTPPEAVKTDDAFTDSRLAERVADEVLAGRYCWIPGLGWLRWDGRRWSECSDKNVGEAVRQWTLDRFQEAVAKGTTSGRMDKDEVSGWMSVEAASKQRAVIGLAAGIVERSIDELDGDPDLLNTPSGVVDLRTGQLRPHDPDLMMSKITAADYRPGAQHPDWTKALDAVPEDIRDWFRLRMGQALTGHMTPDDRLVVCQGSGANGKTTVMDTIGRAAGDYYILASDRILLANPDQHPTEIMDLQGVRLAVAEETPEARRLSVVRLKKTIGTPRIRARKVHRDTVEFDATHSFFLSTNYRPVIEETDRGTWRRLALVRFPFTFRKAGEDLVGANDRRSDEGLRDRAKLDPEVWTAALAWMVDGARAWYDLGRVMPPLPARVETDTRDWRTESDQVLAYLDDRLRFDRDRHVMATDLLADLNDWLDDRGHRPWSDKTLAARFGDHEEIAGRHVEKRKTRASAALSRPPDRTPYGAPFDMANDDKPMPRTYAAWHGLRFATDEDLAEDQVDDHDQDPGQGDDQAAGGDESSRVPAVPADSKLSQAREIGEVSENPEHPEQAGDEDQDPEQIARLDQLQDELEAILDWLDTIGPDPLDPCPKCQAEELHVDQAAGLTICLAEGCDYLRSRDAFTDWLLDQTEHADDLVRTLAREVADDDKWPDDADTLDELATYIAGHENHDCRIIIALRRAWSLFTGQPVDDDDQDQDQPPTLDLDQLDPDDLPLPGGPSGCCQGPSLIIREGRWIKRACMTTGCQKRERLREVTAA
jgi:P4 family phage/plasmid primase-like protien